MLMYLMNIVKVLKRELPQVLFLSSLLKVTLNFIFPAILWKSGLMFLKVHTKKHRKMFSVSNKHTISMEYK